MHAIHAGILAVTAVSLQLDTAKKVRRCKRDRERAVRALSKQKPIGKLAAPSRAQAREAVSFVVMSCRLCGKCAE